MSNFPNNYDDDTTLPFVNDNITEIGGDAINALRDAVVATQEYLGLGGAGSAGSISARLGVSLQPDGTIKPSAITSLGLVTLPITENQIAVNANIPESKLKLDYRTQDLFNYVRDLAGDVNQALGWISITGIKLEPHLMGAIYRHTLDQVDVSNDVSKFLYANDRMLRDNLNAYTLTKDMNDELLAHQWADGSPFGTPHVITTNNGSVYSSIYAHTGSGIFLNTSRFNNIPQTADDVQQFVEYMDSASIFLLGTRIQNLYTNGISRVSRSSSLTLDGYGQSIIPSTPATAFLKNIGNISNPFDDIDSGDDIIELKPSSADQANNSFDAKFALVKVGDIIRINYGTIEVPFIIKEKKYSGTPGSKKYIVRVAGKNHFYAPNAIARIDKPLYNGNKFGELALSPVNNQFAGIPSLIVNNPRAAQALGLGFNPDQLDEKHYLLYLALFPTGHAQDGYTILPGIDVTGNQGITPGAYSLESVVQATNDAFRAAGYNYRFTAFSYQGEFGVALADSYNGAAFSIVSAALNDSGTVDVLGTQVNLPNNVVDLVPVVGLIAQDPLGFGPTGSGVASPPYYTSYANPIGALNPTKLFVPLRRNNYYVNGSEKERLSREPSQALDGYGDGYWVATIQDVSVPTGRVQTTYRIPLNLSTSGLKAGKTIVVQSLGEGALVDYGRFIIQSVVFGCEPTTFTDITVFDSVHAVGSSPSAVLQPFSQVALYFGSDSVSFNTESATDYSVVTPFKRHFEVYVDTDGNTFTHERARMNISGDTVVVNGVNLYGFSQLNRFDILKVSPKLRGFKFGNLNKTTLRVFNYSAADGTYDGYLANYDGNYFTHYGPRTTGRKGAPTRFYDESNTDYIEVVLDQSLSISDISDRVIDIQLFPSLALDDEIMLLGTCQVNDTTKQVNRLRDGRQFGNTSEKDLSTSVFNYMSAPEKHLHVNGVVRGFDMYEYHNGGPNAILSFMGGVALVNGKFLNVNQDTVTIPAVRESYNSQFWDINWIVCLTETGDYKLIPLLDPDPSGNIGLTPDNKNRTFTATDMTTAATYGLQAATFEELINKRTDLLPLYIVRSTVDTSSGTNVYLSPLDTRRFVYKREWGDRPTLASKLENGDFRSFESLTTWLNTNYVVSNHITVRGVWEEVPNNWFYKSRTTFHGDGYVQFTLTGTTLQNLEFHDVNFVSNNGAYSGWQNCAIYNGTFDGYHNVQMDGCTVKNVVWTARRGARLSFLNTTFENCTFYFNSNLININGSKFINCTFFFGFGNNPSEVNTMTSNTFSNNVWNGCSFYFRSLNNNIGLTGKFDNCDMSVEQQQQIVFQNHVYMTNCRWMFASDGTHMFAVEDFCNGAMIGNYFSRGSTNFTNGFIVAPTGGFSSIVFADNFFEQSTSGPGQQRVIQNLPKTWVFSNNANVNPIMQAKVVTGVTTYNLLATDRLLMVNLSAPGLTINLPAAANCMDGRIITVKDTAGLADTSPITFARANTTDLIENLAANYVYRSPYGSITLIASNGAWYII